MPKENVNKILQTKLAISERAFRTNEAPRLSILDAVRTINHVFKTPSERRALTESRALECRGYKDDGDVIGLYLVGYVPDDSVGIVPHTKEELALLDPPEESDFLDGELIALISEETVIICRLGLFESALNKYIQFLGPKAGLNKDDSSFIFKNRTDLDKLKIIQEDGVSSIKFNGVANSTSIQHINDSTPRDFVGHIVESVWEEVRALTCKDKKERRDTENLKVEVYIKYDKRTGSIIDQEEMRNVAELVSEEDEGFEITTLSGRRITPKDVLLNKKINVRRYGKSVAFSEVFSEMLRYYDELTAPAESSGDGEI